MGDSLIHKISSFGSILFKLKKKVEGFYAFLFEIWIDNAVNIKWIKKFIPILQLEQFIARRPLYVQTLLITLRCTILVILLIFFVLYSLFQFSAVFLFYVILPVLFSIRLSKLLNPLKYAIPKRYKEEVIGDLLEVSEEMRSEKLSWIVRIPILLIKILTIFFALSRVRLEDFVSEKSDKKIDKGSTE